MSHQGGAGPGRSRKDMGGWRLGSVQSTVGGGKWKWERSSRRGSVGGSEPSGEAIRRRSESSVLMITAPFHPSLLHTSSKAQITDCCLRALPTSGMKLSGFSKYEWAQNNKTSHTASLSCAQEPASRMNGKARFFSSL